MIKVALLCLMLCFNVNLFASDPSIDLSLPDEVSAKFAQQHLWDRYSISTRVNPFYQRGDFDGDGKPDFAVLVTANFSHEEAIVFVLSSRPKAIISPQRGRPCDGWIVLTPDATPTLKSNSKREGLVIKFGGPGILFVWDGEKFKSHPWGE
ncbi:MAG: hypothetical protein WBN92_21605, partial [Terriglobia bacterium]